MNLANTQQAAFGLKVTAEDFIKGAGCTNFPGTPQTQNADTSDSMVLEELTRRFLLAVWKDGRDADEAMADVVAERPDLAMLVGRAADGIEARHGLRWGVRTSRRGVDELLKELGQ